MWGSLRLAPINNNDLKGYTDFTLIPPAYSVFELLIRLLTSYRAKYVYKAVQCFILPKGMYISLEKLWASLKARTSRSSIQEA